MANEEIQKLIAKHDELTKKALMYLNKGNKELAGTYFSYAQGSLSKLSELKNIES